MLNVTVIGNLHATAVTQPRFAQPLSGQFRLRRAQRDSYRFHAIVSSGLHDQSTPTATNVQKTLATVQPQFSADLIQLPLLSRIQVFFRCGEVGAGINHALIEPHRVELARKIVVIADGLPVTLSRMKFTAEIGWTPVLMRAVVCRQLLQSFS